MRTLRGWLAMVIVGAVAFAASAVQVRLPDEATRPLETIRASALPREGRDVLVAIHDGGPFVSKRDGIAFGNREGLLPRRARGYYAEYTVPTPGERTRGARRIIAGRGTTGSFRNSDEYYYTNDHYQSFRRILQ